MGPVVILLTLAVFVTGIALLLGPSSWRHQMLLLHKDTFILWLAVMTVHVVAHFMDTTRLAPRDWLRRTRRQVDGAGARQWAIAASVAIGLVLAILVVPQVGPWLKADHGHHRERNRGTAACATARHGIGC